MASRARVPTAVRRRRRRSPTSTCRSTRFSRSPRTTSPSLQGEIGADGRRARDAAAARLRTALGRDVGRGRGRVPRARPARRGRRHGHDRRSVPALRGRSRRRHAPGGWSTSTSWRPTASARAALGGDDGLEVERRLRRRATTGEGRSGSTSTGSSIRGLERVRARATRPSALRELTLDLVARSGFTEYYEPDDRRAAREPRVLLERVPHARPAARSTVSYDPSRRTRVVGRRPSSGLRGARGATVLADGARVDRGRRRRDRPVGAGAAAALRSAFARARRRRRDRRHAASCAAVGARSSASRPNRRSPDDPVFARIFGRRLADLFGELPDRERRRAADARLRAGSALVPHDLLWCADLPKRRQPRRGAAAATPRTSASRRVRSGSEKRLLFVDWPLLDRHKRALAPPARPATSTSPTRPRHARSPATRCGRRSPGSPVGRSGRGRRSCPARGAASGSDRRSASRRTSPTSPGRTS